MITMDVSETTGQLAEIVRRVRAGESFKIVDHEKEVMSITATPEYVIPEWILPAENPGGHLPPLVSFPHFKGKSALEHLLEMREED